MGSPDFGKDRFAMYVKGLLSLSLIWSFISGCAPQPTPPVTPDSRPKQLNTTTTYVAKDQILLALTPEPRHNPLPPDVLATQTAINLESLSDEEIKQLLTPFFTNGLDQSVTVKDENGNEYTFKDLLGEAAKRELLSTTEPSK